MGARANNRAAPAWPRASPYASRTGQMSIYCVLGEGWTILARRRNVCGSIRSPYAVEMGEAKIALVAGLLLGIGARQRRPQRNKNHWLIRSRVSSTVTPSKSCTPFHLERIPLPQSKRHPKEWRNPLNRKNRETHILCLPSFVVWPPQNHGRP
jgi:hypothetical protein